MFWILFRVAVLAYVGFGILLYVLQDKVAFPAGGTIWRTPAAPPYAWTYDDLTIAVGEEKTHAWFIPAKVRKGTVLFSHGNAGTIADRLESVEVFHALGFDVLIYDYGGYGQSSGKPSERRCYDDARAMWRHLIEERGLAPGEIVLFGRSLGAAVTTQLALEVQPRGVILESAFLSGVQLAREWFPIYPAGLLVRHRFDNAAKIGEFSCPAMFIHSPDDEIIPYRHGRRLFELAPEPKEFLEIRGSHNEGFLVSGMVYNEGLARFLQGLFEKDA